MNQRYLEQWTKIAKNIQRPFQAMLELNLEMMEKVKYLKVEDFINIKNPEELLEKQVNFAIENGHRTLDYFQRSFEIFEQVLGPITESVKQSTTSTMETAKSLKTLLHPAKLGMAPTKAAINLAKPLLDPTLSISDPMKIMEELSNADLSPKEAKRETQAKSGTSKKAKAKKAKQLKS
ncbi:phasin family protein [Legionella jordanis]|uniref:Phasin protein n=1 Tax=Legionella jordanis TaxID=456 RepID=A0A0W0VDD7_9GAMM|nr:phasin family protein [Legionella jordanis]KTD18104.1 hypothetical protein Ljor_2410 [Legionella jordanis]RMX00583.1 hypothetical protein EAW55_12545 [Legionella jordanis]RMX21301.1 hypothetical protein EAS68_03780 [Legionella jordanis]VEH13803.1 Uncharacterised protein [Legionella jordanis]HAT8714185.1 hypothetical protein [Legionella jordanis]